MADVAPLFGRLAELYDAWCEGPVGRVAFPLEAECLRRLLQPCPRPWLEVGVGSGRFAAALGVEVGLDPASRPLRMALARGVQAVQGAGEHLPFAPGAFGAVLLVVTLCFVADPLAVLREARRVLRPDGSLVLGLVFAESPWGRYYQRRAEEGHPFYSAARFLTRAEAGHLLHEAGLRIVGATCTLLQPPREEGLEPEPVREGDSVEAGFSCWRAVPTP
jgi:SAM-dependent methyltransferase